MSNMLRAAMMAAVVRTKSTAPSPAPSAIASMVLSAVSLGGAAGGIGVIFAQSNPSARRGSLNPSTVMIDGETYRFDAWWVGSSGQLTIQLLSTAEATVLRGAGLTIDLGNGHTIESGDLSQNGAILTISSGIPRYVAGQSYSIEISEPSIAAPPTGLMATPGENQVRLDWTAAASRSSVTVDGYDIRYRRRL